MVGADGACGLVLLDAVYPGLGEAVKVLTKMHQQSDKYFPSPDFRLCPTHEIVEFFPLLSFLYWPFSCSWSPLMARAYIRWAAGRECPGSTLCRVILPLSDTQVVSCPTDVGPTIVDSLGGKGESVHR